MKKFLYLSTFVLLFSFNITNAQVTPAYPTTTLNSCWSYSQAWAVGPTSLPSTYSNIQLQTGSTTCGTYPASASFSFQPYNSGSVIILSGAFNLSTSTLNIGLNASFSGKYALVQVSNGTYTSNLDFSTILAIPSGTSPAIYSIDFNPVKGNTLFNLSTVNKIYITVYDQANATSSPNNLTGTFTISNLQVNALGTATGVSLLTNPSLSQVWTMSSNGLIYNNQNSQGVAIGINPATFNKAYLTYPYYSFNINGRTNIFGNDNALEIWSNNVGTNGKRHYLGFSNLKFSDNVTEYSLITAGEYGGSFTPKHLTLQNFQDPNNAGNVGIGYFTTPPAAKLSVNGNVLIGNVSMPNAGTKYKLFVEKGILTEGLKIAFSADAVNWSDFVFDPSYCLMSLNEVEAFVKTNKHLPEIPSAKEIYSTGLDVAQMDAKLLQKIEELTLYMIEMKKENEAMKLEMEALKKLNK